MDEFILTYDTSTLELFPTLVCIGSLISIVIAIIKKRFICLAPIPFIIVTCLFSYALAQIDALEKLKKEAINRIDSVWIEKVKNNEIANIPVRSIEIDGNYLKIRLLNDEVYYTLFEEISPFERKISPDFYKSIDAYKIATRRGGAIIPVIVH